MHENLQQSISQDREVERGKTWGAISLAAILLLVSIYFLAYSFQLAEGKFINITRMVFILSILATTGSIYTSLRGNRNLGLVLSIVTLLLIGVMASALFLGRTLSASISILAVSSAAVAWLAPRKQRIRYALMVGGAVGIMWLFEWADPAWRMPLSAAMPGPAAAITFGSILAVLVYFQMREAINRSLRFKIIIWTGGIAILLSVILVGYSILTTRQASIENAQTAALAVAEAQARQIRADAEIPLVTARALAHALTAVKDPGSGLELTREDVNSMLRRVLVENPSYLGTYTLWESNAFDGLDSEFQNQPAHDGTGRFIPYWIRSDGGSISVIPLEQYETPGIGDWYILPRQSKTEVTLAPLIYPINGVDTVMASFVVPIIYDEKFYGIVGVDAPITFVQGIVDSINLYNGNADAVLLTSTGTLIGVRNRPELINQPAAEIYPDFDQLQTRIEAGESFISLSPDGNFLRVFAPVDLGQTGQHWSFGLIIPFSEVTAPATAAATQQAGISIGLILFSILALWYLSNQITRPIIELTGTANAIAQGNLNISANVQSQDETGTLANAFNLMTLRLSETLATLEQRVADRTQNLVLAAEVGRAVSRVRDLDDMLKDACELILKEFNLYYVQVYLTDAANSKLKLEAGTGSVGVQLLERNHSLPLDTKSINGRAAMEKSSVVIPDTSKSAVFRPNALLPDTRGEMAVPLVVAEKVVGVLDMQSSRPDVLTKDVLPAFEALAGQLAVAVQNANLLAETEQARAQVEAQARRLVREGWDEHLDAIHKPERIGYVFDHNAVTPLTSLEESALPEGSAAVSAPISVTGESLGSLVVEVTDEERRGFTSELVNIVAHQVSQQVENLRLLESAERYRLEAERSARLQTVEGWQNYMETAGERLGYKYNLNEVVPADNEQRTDENTLSLPIKVQNETIGRLAIFEVEHRDEATDLVNTIADRLGAHIEGLRLFGQTQVSLAETQALYRINEAISSEMNLDAIYQTVAKLSCDELGFEGSWIAAYDPENDALQGVAGINMPDERIKASLSLNDATPASLAAKTRHVVSVNNPEKDGRMQDIPLDVRVKMGKALSTPVMAGQELLGAIAVTRPENTADIGAREERMIQSIAAQLAIVMQRVKLFDQVRKQAERVAMLNTINQKIQSATSVEAVLQIAARELGHALGAPMTVAQLTMKDSTS